jgi:hypothetical protein
LPPCSKEPETAQLLELGHVRYNFMGTVADVAAEFYVKPVSKMMLRLELSLHKNRTLMAMDLDSHLTRNNRQTEVYIVRRKRDCPSPGHLR